MKIVKYEIGRVPARCLSVERLREVVSYDPETGRFYWRSTKGGRIAGREAGCLSPCGYLRLRIDGRRYPAHHLAWLHEHGALPAGFELDHRDCDRTNNAITNLRRATRRQNMANSRPSPRNKLRLKGVCFRPEIKKFRAYIKLDGKQKSLGVFVSAEEASAAYARASVQAFGEFARHA